jgi:hypothetical protein
MKEKILQHLRKRYQSKPIKKYGEKSFVVTQIYYSRFGIILVYTSSLSEKTTTFLARKLYLEMNSYFKIIGIYYSIMSIKNKQILMVDDYFNFYS